jgi:hypothetical protein
LDAAGGHGGKPRSGLAGFDLIADLELPLPDIRIDALREAVRDAFVDHDEPSTPRTLPEG